VHRTSKQKQKWHAQALLAWPLQQHWPQRTMRMHGPRDGRAAAAAASPSEQWREENERQQKSTTTGRLWQSSLHQGHASRRSMSRPRPLLPLRLRRVPSRTRRPSLACQKPTVPVQQQRRRRQARRGPLKPRQCHLQQPQRQGTVKSYSLVWVRARARRSWLVRASSKQNNTSATRVSTRTWFARSSSAVRCHLLCCFFRFRCVVPTGGPQGPSLLAPACWFDLLSVALPRRPAAA